ncbi:MAG: lyase family protein, partial [Patescibacteria group bacterium]
VLSGKYNSEFITDQIQGGAGTSVHSNVNEVISTLATQESKLNIHSNDHVNKGQSTNDVVPTAMRVVFLQEIDKLTKNIDTLINDLEVYAHKYKNLPRMGRTHLQDAVPLTIEMQFLAYAEFFKRSSLQLRAQKELLFRNNLGGTAIGTGLNSVEGFSEKINKELAELTGYPLYPAKNLIDATQNSDDFLNLSAQVNTFAGGLNKIVNDLRLLVSGPRTGIAEFRLAEVQKGSTIMPGKANPVVLEMVNQICQQVFGNATAAFHALISGQLELNVMLPLFFKNTLESMELLSYAVTMLSEKVLPSLSPNLVQIQKHLDESLYAATALSKKIGYDRASKIVTEAIQQELTIRDILIKEGVLTDSEIDGLLDPLQHVRPSAPYSA